MLRYYDLGLIGKCKRKHNDLALVFVRPFRVMPKRIKMEKYGSISVLPYL
jgi:hypothetical protein